MTKIDLRKSSGFPLTYENDDLLSSELKYKSKVITSITDIQPQLLNNEINCPEIFCKKYLGIDNDDIFKQKGLAINVYVVMPNLAGIEFVKTRANIADKYNRVIEIAYGGGSLILQNFEDSLHGDIIISNLKKGQKAIIPSGYEFSISNTKSSILVVLEFLSINENIHNSLDDANGMSYYVIRKNAKQEIVRNPLYRLANKPRKVSWEKVLTGLSITSKTPIIKQILRKYEKFDWLFTPTRFTV